jgi:hypothetical protein
MLERAVSDTERGDTEPGTAYLRYNGPAAGGHDGYTPFFCNSIFVYTSIKEIGMVAPAKLNQHRERSE